MSVAYFVSPDGDDDATGRSPEPTADGDGPFRTLDAAREAVREAISDGMDDDAVVSLRGGTYYREEPLRFGPEDSGRDGHEVVYTNYADETPRVVGGTPVTGWEHQEGAIYRADVDHDFNLLYADGDRCTLARTPDDGYSRVRALSEEAPHRVFEAHEDAVPEGPVDELQVHVWPGGPDGEWNWFSDIIDVESIDRDAGTVRLAGETRYELGPGSRYFFQGSEGLLSAPGEFYLDREAGTVSYWPRGDVESTEIVAPAVTRLLEFRGRSTAERVHDVRIEGLTLEVTDRTRTVGSIDGESTPRHGAVHLTNARDVTIERSRIRSTGLDAVAGIGAVENVTIENNHVHDIGHGGVQFRGDVSSRYENRQHRIRNNHVHDTGALIGHGHGITLQQSGNCEVSHNRIHHTARIGIMVSSMPRPTTMTGVDNDPETSAMCIDGVRPTPESVPLFQHARNNVVANNDISHCNLDSQDTGLVYTNTGGRGNIVHQNRLHHSDVPFSFGFGLYLDDTSDGVTATNNVIHDLNHEGDGDLRYTVYAKGLDDRLANNVLADNNATVAAFGSHEHGGSYNRDQVIERNVVANSGPNVHGFSNWSVDRIAKSDHNVVFDSAGEYGVHGIPERYAVEGDSYAVETLDDWTAAFGYDEHSERADPKFLAPEADDYRLRHDSPAWDHGFQPIDHAAIGLTASFPFAEVEPVRRVFVHATGEDGTLSALDLESGETATLFVTARTETGYVADLDGGDVIFESENPDVAGVDEDGLVEAIGDGVAEITATVSYGGGEASAPVHVLVDRE